MGSTILVEGVGKTYYKPTGEVVHALSGVNMTLEAGTFYSFVGPSGCGKTTLLHMIHGLIPQAEGAIHLNGKLVEGPTPDKAVVFQQPLLLPWRNVVDNIKFGIENHRSIAEKEKREAQAELAKMRVDALANKTQIDVMQKTLSEFSAKSAAAQFDRQEMQKLIDGARRTLDVEQKAADAGLHDNPKTVSTTLDATESEICAHFIGLARQRKESCELNLARLQLDRKATAAKIDVEQTRDSFARLLTAIEPTLEKLKSDHSAVLQQAKESEARALKHLRWFQQKHDLHHRAAAYPESHVYHFAIVAALALVEWVSLATFYAFAIGLGVNLPAGVLQGIL